MTRGKKRRAPESEDPLLLQMGQIGNIIKERMANHEQKDESDNIGAMVATQHRSLQPDQRAYFVAEIAKAYVSALSYTSHQIMSVEESWRT